MELKDLSEAQRAGQRLMIGFNGTQLSDDLRFLIKKIYIGGIILFARNISTPRQLKNLCLSVQAYADSCGQPPLFIAIDQEGGQVARLKEPFTQFSGNPQMESREDAINFAQITAAELSGVGINMNMAPVMDVAPENMGSVMAGRAFGADPLWVAELGASVIKHLQDNHIMAVAKHFPGIGRTSLDSHFDLPVLDTDLPNLESSDLLPFQAAIKHGVAGTMLSHVVYPQIDPDWPASLSEIIAKKILRDHMGYTGLVLTDDLDMGAITAHFDIQQVARQIIAAGIDMALICHLSSKIEITFEEILRGYRDSRELMSKGDVSVERILRLKQKYLAGTNQGH